MQDTPLFAQMNHALFPLLSSLAFLLSHLLIYLLLTRHIATRRYVQRLYDLALCLNLACSIAYIFLRYTLVPKWLLLPVSLAVGVMVSLLLGALLAGALRLVQRQNLAPRYRQAILSLCCLYSLYATYHGLASPQVRHTTLVLHKLRAPLTITQVSDVHIGGLMDTKRVAEIVALANATSPDLIALTGDLVDTSLENAESSLQLLKDLRARYGVYYVLGNHEYLHDAGAILARLSKLGIHTLVNTSSLIGAPPLINLAGSADFMGDRLGFLTPNFEATLAGLHPELPTVLLSHQPKVSKLLPKSLQSQVDVILAGHTHGGAFFPISLAVLLQQPYLKGLHHLPGGGAIYVSEGAGFWGAPMRAGSSAEITVLHLLPAHKEGESPSP